MTYTEIAEYVLGNRFTGEIVQFEPVDIEIVNRARQYLSGVIEHGNADLASLNFPKVFYKQYPDLKAMIPAVWHDEVYYALCNGGIAKGVPCKVLYLIKRAYNVYKSPNILWKLLTDEELRWLFQMNLLDKSLNLKDVVCNFCDKDYSPVSETNLRNKLSTHTEVYFPRLDAVALLCDDIADALSDKDISIADADGRGGIHINGRYISTLAGHRGGVNSIYDLRHVV